MKGNGYAADKQSLSLRLKTRILAVLLGRYCPMKPMGISYAPAILTLAFDGYGVTNAVHIRIPEFVPLQNNARGLEILRKKEGWKVPATPTPTDQMGPNLATWLGRMLMPFAYWRNATSSANLLQMDLVVVSAV